ncbi:hypothetical protein KW5_0122885 [Xanthomonas vasicola pv. vasculorum NCPPB 1326]|nr:hypothetical protein KW5_0122885 [Xanthomonas vasicola pv. vasculorum NCPPB 1326]KFA27568.1 hypothetical protein KWG_0121305 [Xanthomonas vasicola pv. vasculorum NCPPB 1381]
MTPRRKSDAKEKIPVDHGLASGTSTADSDVRIYVKKSLEGLKRPEGGWYFEEALGPLSNLAPNELKGISDMLKSTNNVRNIFSFGARSGGFELAMQFRHDLNVDDTKRGLEVSSESNYLDAISLEGHSHTKNDKIENLDVFKMKNPFWDIGYKNGIEHADKMVLFITPEWMASKFCIQEFEWLRETNNKNIKAAFFVYKDVDVDDPIMDDIHKYAESNGSLVMKAISPPEDGLHEISIRDSLPLSFKRLMRRSEYNSLKDFLSED